MWHAPVIFIPKFAVALFYSALQSCVRRGKRGADNSLPVLGGREKKDTSPTLSRSFVAAVLQQSAELHRGWMFEKKTRDTTFCNKEEEKVRRIVTP